METVRSHETPLCVDWLEKRCRCREMRRPGRSAKGRGHRGQGGPPRWPPNTVDVQVLGCTQLLVESASLNWVCRYCCRPTGTSSRRTLADLNNPTVGVSYSPGTSVPTYRNGRVGRCRPLAVRVQAATSTLGKGCCPMVGARPNNVPVLQLRRHSGAQARR